MNAENITQTVPVFGDFIADFEQGREVQFVDASARFVWTGVFQNTSSGRFALLYDLSGAIQPVDVLVREQWVAGEPTPSAIFRAAQLAAQKHVEVAALRREVELSRAEVEGVRRDVETINEMANDEASNRDMCSDYDDVVERINQRLTHVELQPRSKEFDVSVDVTFRYNLRLKITARNADAARDEVENMCEDDIIRELRDVEDVHVDADYHNFDFDVDDVSEA